MERKNDLMKILGYSSYSNEEQYQNVLRAFRAISETTERVQNRNEYGTGLETLLIFYNFEAVPDEFAETDFLQRKFEVQRYNSKEKSLRINVFVGYDELTNRSYEEQTTFYYNTTMHAIELVKERFVKRRRSGVDIDFKKLHQDIKRGFLETFHWLK